MKRLNGKLTLAAAFMIAVFVIAGCGGGGGSRTTSSSDQGETASKLATISGTATIEGLDDCSEVVVVAEKVSDGVTRTVQKMLDSASSGVRSSSRVAAETEGVYMTSTNDSCKYSLSVSEGTYSVSAYKEDTVGSQPQRVSARSAAVVTVNFDLVATGKVSGTVALGTHGDDIVVVFLDGTSFGAFADSSGNYEISNVPVGTYTIKFSRKGTVYASNTGVTVSAGTTTSNTSTSVSFTCVVDTDCDDGLDTTGEECVGPATSGSYCINPPIIAGGTTIDTNTTWDSSAGTITVTGQIKVASGTTLTIGAGTRIEFTYPTRGAALFDNSYASNEIGGIRVDGSLVVNGTSASPVTFTLDDEAALYGAGYWGGLYYTYTSTGNSLTYVNMEYAGYPITVDGGVAPTMSHVTITDVGYPAGGYYSYAYSYHVSAKTSQGWQEAGVKHYGLEYEPQAFDLSSYLPDADGEYKVRIQQVGMHAAHIENIALVLDGIRYSPVSAVDISTGQNVLYKVSAIDNDVADAHLKTFEVTFAPHTGAAPSRAELVLTAREEGDEVLAGGKPFRFPRNVAYTSTDMASTYSYTMGSNYGSPVLDGHISSSDRLPEPSFVQRAKPMSGHPEGDVYAYFQNDDNYLYGTIDFTPDNTFDGTSDYAAIYVKTGGVFKVFKLSVGNTTYGMVGFNYSGNVSYQHKIYEFAIPLSEIGGPAEGQPIEYIVEAYGTSSEFSSAIYIYDTANISMEYVTVDFADSPGNSYMYGIYTSYITNSISMSHVSVTGSTDDAIYLDIGYTSGTVALEYITANESGSYGMYVYGPYGSTKAFTCQYCDFSFNESYGLRTYSASPTITYSRAEGNCSYGMYIYGYGYGETANISNTNIIDNYSYGIYNSGATTNLTNVFLSGNAGVGSGVVDNTTTASTSQKVVTSVTSPAGTAITGTGVPTVSGSVDCGYSYP